MYWKWLLTTCEPRHTSTPAEKLPPRHVPSSRHVNFGPAVSAVGSVPLHAAEAPETTILSPVGAEPYWSMSMLYVLVSATAAGCVEWKP